MPIQPSAARRRFHTDRVVAKRVRQAKTLSITDPAEFVRGRLDDEQWYVGCHRARCGVCHPDKRWPSGNRQREERAWRRAEELASTDASSAARS
jgi:hypothetical protein